MLPQSPQPAGLQGLDQSVEAATLMRRVRAGANNFYWIAGLSLLNSLISAFNGALTFVIGLGITQLTDAIAYYAGQSNPEISLLLRFIGLGISLVFSALFALFGFFGSKDKRWALIAGLLLYSLDTILVLVFQDWYGLIFHLLMLAGIVMGLVASNKLRRSLQGAGPDPSFPKDIGS